ncbi:MAG: histidine kinase dimerization/phospho-acceptor domain-containing protein, partial [Gammaproteobacteria bacterium]
TVARDQTEKRRLEEQLRQSQKMEAVGRLAGGIAHDFNNLLTAMIGFSELALGNLSAADPSHADVAQVLELAQSAAGLTHQLLAFSRQQTLEPVVVDVNALVGRMDGLLRRVIGDDVVLETATGNGICRTIADPVQLEQVILNLAVNARDAMPGGGRFTLRAAPDPADPGSVLVEAVDTGQGM